MNADTGEIRPLVGFEANTPIGEQLPTGEVVVSTKVAKKLSAGDKYYLQKKRRRQQVRKSRQKNRLNK